MNIVFIVGSYYPNYSAVGKCVSNVAEVLAKKNRVTVICVKNDLNQKETEVYNNQTILRITTTEINERLKLTNIIKKTNGIYKRLCNISLNVLKLKQMFRLVFSQTSTNKELINSYMACLKEINFNIDVIIPASMPFESVIAAYRYKREVNSGAILLPYLFDRFTDSPTLHRFNFNRLIKRKANLMLEKEVLCSAYRILAMHTLKDYFSDNIPEINRIIYLEHPLIVVPQHKSRSLSTIIKLAYIGGFYKNYVEPDYLLMLLSKVSINMNCEFYTIGNCSDIINDYSENYSLKIINKGSLDKDNANRKIADYNILINVAENRGLQLSSKIFDYISYGKPIIHFYKNDNDINFKILKKYPLVLFLKEDKEYLFQNVRNFEDFCSKNYKNSVSWTQIIELYSDALPEHTARIIEEIIGSVISFV